MMKQSQEVLGVKIVGGLKEASTPWAGASLLVELLRRSGVDAVANKVLPAMGSAKGLKQPSRAESLHCLRTPCPGRGTPAHCPGVTR
ncbi:MAG: hypothetical protein Q8O05_06530 [Chloroflexota bacterium]|nr:hypothetical protein [Chloroflexota bacterium]